MPMPDTTGELDALLKDFSLCQFHCHSIECSRNKYSNHHQDVDILNVTRDKIGQHHDGNGNQHKRQEVTPHADEAIADEPVGEKLPRQEQEDIDTRKGNHHRREAQSMTGHHCDEQDSDLADAQPHISI